MRLQTRPSRFPALLVLGAIASGAAVLAACSGGPSEPERIGEGTSSIIGGVDARSPSLDAIGSLGIEQILYQPPPDADAGAAPPPITSYRYFCGATLVAPQTVLTAKHCAEVYARSGASVGAVNMYFGIGPDSNTPRRKVRVIDVEMAPLNDGGFVGRGSDVAVMHLEEAVTDVTPLKIGAPFTPKDVGKKLTAIGYGIQDNLGTDGTRKAGTTTLRAIEGKTFQLMFPSYDDFRDAVLASNGFAKKTADISLFDDTDGGAPPTEPPPDGGFPPDLEAQIRAWYDNETLLKDYDVLVGGAPGDVQDCYGDSGSALIRKVGSELKVFGVVSGGLGSRKLICDNGGVYATFGGTTREFLTKAIAWKDPCKTITTKGVCDRDVAIRCTGVAEGARRLTRADCGNLLQTCGRGADGVVACVDP